MKEESKYQDFSNVEAQREKIIPEDLPEGPYGSPFHAKSPVQNKSTPWEEGQHSISASSYENKSLHKGQQRKDPGSHPPK
ncbi:hypothetical protein [Alkalihalobacillus trypoxylicola]|uniref:Cytosolic protein n=1 Tax=Alkalihalobacillus trypoxylicola TaxID=519424 RepID=A0A162ERJ1_9BACI|nr:hypothetical protein [Alkalihalobacillus trypoxylicola]KYG33546.1 hypothetical protein AZF04_16435 [Alkalihalobacillus trypoxylicola]GAF64929.1 hypothetical protein BTS2_1825 [Bacillus sp. TS-2]